MRGFVQGSEEAKDGICLVRDSVYSKRGEESSLEFGWIRHAWIPWKRVGEYVGWGGNPQGSLWGCFDHWLLELSFEYCFEPYGWWVNFFQIFSRTISSFYNVEKNSNNLRLFVKHFFFQYISWTKWVP